MVRSRAPRAALLGTIAFTLCVPGTVVGFVPSWLAGWKLAPPLLGIAGTRWAGMALIVLGAPLFFDFVTRFVREGHGTPAPVAPKLHLVVGGPYRRVRNPGYVAVLAMVVGQGLVYGSATVLLYAAALAVAFHAFVVLYEEPALQAQFGDEYAAYRAEVPRWLPRLR